MEASPVGAILSQLLWIVFILLVMALYPQPAQRTSGVDYVPVPYHPEAPPQPQRAPAARRRNTKAN